MMWEMPVLLNCGMALGGSGGSMNEFCATTKKTGRGLRPDV
jgi:hypothetical protein